MAASRIRESRGNPSTLLRRRWRPRRPMDRRNHIDPSAIPQIIEMDEATQVAIEARNALRQYDALKWMVGRAIARGPNAFRLCSGHLRFLNKLAVTDTVTIPGAFRRASIQIDGSKHQCPAHAECRARVNEMCDHVNARWQSASAMYLSAYVMWRLNWIHPFPDGNGRSSRAASYAVLCIRTGYFFPGTATIPSQILADKQPYYQALEAADSAYLDTGRVDVSAMESLLTKMLQTQLEGVLADATC